MADIKSDLQSIIKDALDKQLYYDVITLNKNYIVEDLVGPISDYIEELIVQAQGEAYDEGYEKRDNEWP